MPRIPDETRAAIAADIRAGKPYREIADTHGVSMGSVANIADEHGITPPGAEQVEAAANASKLKWAQRREALVDELGEVAAELLQKARTAAAARDAQAYATSVAILVDKAQLVSGGVTSRHEQLGLERQRQRVLSMTDELEERRRQKDGTTGG